MRETLPLAVIHDAVLDFLRGREDAVLFGAQAVNAYVDEPRMTQDVDILSSRAAELADELRDRLGTQFHIAVHVRIVQGGAGYRVYQVRQPKNRHLVDVRAVGVLPPTRRVDQILVTAPADLICQKVLSMVARPHTPKGGTDLADLRRLLLAFPDLKTEEGAVAERLRAAGAPGSALAAWKERVAEEILPEPEDEAF